jgi:hypothetical protein
MGHVTGREPGLGSQAHLSESPACASGLEPMLGGERRPRLDRALFLDLIEMDGARRLAAVDAVLEQGAGRFYGAAMAAVLSPGARYFQPGRLWKTPYSYEHKLAAMDSLLRLDPDRALAGLIVALNNQDLGVQRAAILFMGQLEEDHAQSALLAILDDPRPELRHVALHALADRWGLPAVKHLARTKGYTVGEAARSLSCSAHNPSVLIALIAALWEERETAYDTQLAQVALVEVIVSSYAGDTTALVIKALSRLLDNRRTDSIVADHAVSALRLIDTSEARAAAIRYQSGHDTLDRIAATQPSDAQHAQRT